MSKLTAIGNASLGATISDSPPTLDAGKTDLLKLLALQSSNAQSSRWNKSNFNTPSGLALHQPSASSVEVTGSMVLSHLYGQIQPASNLLESFWVSYLQATLES